MRVRNRSRSRRLSCQDVSWKLCWPNGRLQWDGCLDDLHLSCLQAATKPTNLTPHQCLKSCKLSLSTFHLYQKVLLKLNLWRSMAECRHTLLRKSARLPQSCVVAASTALARKPHRTPGSEMNCKGGSWTITRTLGRGASFMSWRAKSCSARVLRFPHTTNRDCCNFRATRGGKSEGCVVPFINFLVRSVTSDPACFPFLKVWLMVSCMLRS